MTAGLSLWVSQKNLSAYMRAYIEGSQSHFGVGGDTKGQMDGISPYSTDRRTASQTDAQTERQMDEFLPILHSFPFGATA